MRAAGGARGGSTLWAITTTVCAMVVGNGIGLWSGRAISLECLAGAVMRLLHQEDVDINMCVPPLGLDHDPFRPRSMLSRPAQN